MKRGCFLVFILLTLVLVGGHTQDYKGKSRVTGYVYDAEGNPVPEVRVKLFNPKVGQGFELTTDKEGKWVAAWIQSGAWNIDFEKPGFAPKRIAVELFELKKNPDVKVNLVKAEGSLVTEEVRPELNRGNQLFDEKKYDEAIAVFQGILEKSPICISSTRTSATAISSRRNTTWPKKPIKRSWRKSPMTAKPSA